MQKHPPTPSEPASAHGRNNHYGFAVRTGWPDDHPELQEYFMRLQFHGANRQVTGSRYLLDAGGLRLMIDCGLFQERQFQNRNWDEPATEPDGIDRVLLTHAHLDHCGLLPRLVKLGFDRKVLTTPPSVELAALVMRDSAHLQEEDAAYKKLRHEREGRKGPREVVPLYTADDAERATRLLEPVPYDDAVNLNNKVSVRWHDAGHILGSAILEITVKENGTPRTIVFSGDLGQWDKPLVRDPSLLERADYVVMESTYGDRDHDKRTSVEEQIGRIVSETVKAGGNIVIPTFAIERAQELLYYLGRLRAAGKAPEIPVYLDSPMAVDATEMYGRYQRCLDDETRAMFAAGKSPVSFPKLRLCRTRDESVSINSVRGSCIILAGSGMCNGGRIKHHLRNNIERPESTILMVGYQSDGTLGRQIVDRNPEVRIHGRFYKVKARIAQLQGMSAHADRTSLLRWIKAFNPKPRHVFLTHGEANASNALSQALRNEFGMNVTVPEYLQTVTPD